MWNIKIVVGASWASQSCRDTFHAMEAFSMVYSKIVIPIPYVHAQTSTNTMDILLLFIIIIICSSFIYIYIISNYT